MVRAGWDTERPLDDPVPGVDLGAVRWPDRHGVSLWVGDIGDARPAAFPLPLQLAVF